jgi:MYXO-CTERM domain-containing protein
MGIARLIDIRARAAALAAVIGLGVGCGDVSTQEPLRTHVHEIRPTEPNAYLDIGYEDATVNSWAVPGDHFRVWWAEDGRHAVPSADDDGDGIPNFVETVGTTAEEVADLLEREGWRTALPDEVTNSPLPDGGDDLFDIYLVDFAGGSDGLVVRNVCTNATPATCTAHMLMENDFARSGYSSVEEGIRVLVSHEYFHAVQAAYVDSIPAWYSEGTATWFEEHYYADQSDFERLANGYLSETGRSLNSRSQGPFDSFNYGAALFFHFIDLQYGHDVIRRSLEELSQGAEPLDAIETALGEVDATLAETFERFAAWNVFTGSRAGDGGYPASADYQTVPISTIDASGGVNYDIRVDALSTRYAQMTLSGSATLALAEETDAAVFIVIDPDQIIPLGTEPIETDLVDPILVFANGSRANADVLLRIRNVRPEEPQQEDPPVEPGTGADVETADESEGCSTAGTSGSASALILVLGLLAARTRRRRMAR